MKKYFSKQLVMTKEDNEDFKSYTKCWICDNDYIDNDVKLKGYCHITRKYGGSTHGDCNINNKLNPKIPILFRNLKNYDSNLITQGLGKSNIKISVISNGLEKHMSFTINNKLSFIDSSQFLSFSLDRLVKNLNIYGLKYSTHKFNNNVSDPANEKGFYPYEYIADFGKFKEELPNKEKFYSSLTDRKITDK